MVKIKTMKLLIGIGLWLGNCLILLGVATLTFSAVIIVASAEIIPENNFTAILYSLSTAAVSMAIFNKLKFQN